MDQNERQEVNYLDLPAAELLEQFGQGSHVPGSGSAAALSSLVGIELLRTVCKRTRDKVSYGSVHAQMEYIQNELEENYKPKIVSIFQNDSIEFAKVSELRIQRDQEKDPKKKEQLGRQAIEQLRVATEIPLELCELNFKLLEYSLTIFDNGYKATQGDAGVAISNFLSSISGTLFVIMLNIKVARQSKWTEEKRKQVEELAKKFSSLQRDAFSRVINLYKQGLNDQQTAIDLGS